MDDVIGESAVLTEAWASTNSRAGSGFGDGSEMTVRITRMGDAVCGTSSHAEGMTNNDKRWENLRAGSETAKHLPCSVCGEPVPIPAK